MKLWIGGEIQADIADSFRDARNSVEKTINSYIRDKRYDLPLSSWDVIAIVRDDNELPETVDYSAKQQEMDFRLTINHEDFKRSGELERERLIYQMLIKSLALLKDKGVASSDIEQLMLDVTAVGNRRGWV